MQKIFAVHLRVQWATTDQGGRPELAPRGGLHEVAADDSALGQLLEAATLYHNISAGINCVVRHDTYLLELSASIFCGQAGTDMSGLPRGGRGGAGGGHSQSPPSHSTYPPGYGVMPGLPPPTLPPYCLPPPSWAPYAAPGHHYPPSGQTRQAGLRGPPYPPTGRLPGYYSPTSHSAAAAAAAAAVAARGYPWYGRTLGQGGSFHLPTEPGPSRPADHSASPPPHPDEGAPAPRPSGSHSVPPLAHQPGKPGVPQSDLWLLEHLASCYDVRYELVESVRASLFAHCPDAKLPAWAEARVVLRRLYAIASNSESDQHASTIEVCLSRLDHLAEGDDLPERCRGTIRVPPTLLADAKTYVVFSTIRWNGTSQKLLAGDRESRRIVQREIEKVFSTGDCDMPDVESRSLDLRALLYRPAELVQAISSFSVQQLERDVLKYHDSCTRSLGPTLLEYVEQDMRCCQSRSIQAGNPDAGDRVPPHQMTAPGGLEQRERARPRPPQPLEAIHRAPKPQEQASSMQEQAEPRERRSEGNEPAPVKEAEEDLPDVLRDARGVDRSNTADMDEKERDSPERSDLPPRIAARTATPPDPGQLRDAPLARRVSGSGLRSRLASGGTPMRLPGSNLLRHTKKRPHE